jgi:hypothetical protein
MNARFILWRKPILLVVTQLLDIRSKLMYNTYFIIFIANKVETVISISFDRSLKLLLISLTQSFIW